MNRLATATAAAIVGLAFTVPASAEITMSGFFNQDIGFGSWKSGSEMETEGNVQMDSDAEIHFKASGTTDGGVGVSVKIEMEANAGTTTSIDEGAITFSGGFGSVTLGNEDPAALSHGYVGIGGGYGGMGYYDNGNTYTPGAVANFPAMVYDDSQKVIYSFPSMGGLSLGVSFAPDTNGRTPSTSEANANGQVSVGASYSADLGGTSVSIGGGMVSSTDGDPATPGGEAEKIKGAAGAGISVGFGDSTIHLRTDRNSEADSRALGFAIEHTLGALGIGLGYGVETQKDPFGEDMDHSALVAGVKYDLGGGVGISAAVARGSVEALGADDPDGTPGNADDIAGEDTSAVGLGFRLGFSF